MKQFLIAVLVHSSFAWSMNYQPPEALDIKLRYINTESGIDCLAFIKKTENVEMTRFRYLYMQELNGEYEQLASNILQLPEYNSIVIFYSIKK